jgi:hypothetical protein
MTTIINVTTAFAKASVELEKLCAIQIGRPWYTSVEDYSTPASVAIRSAYEEQEVQRELLLDTMAASSDELVAMERKLGTGRVIRLATASGVDYKVVMTMLNY